MALLKYFSPIPKPHDTAFGISNSSLPRATIVNIENEVERVTKKKSRGSYTRILQAEKAAVAKYANENGVGNAVKHFKEKNVKESSVMHLYQKELKEKCKVTGPDENYVVLELPSSFGF